MRFSSMSDLRNYLTSGILGEPELTKEQAGELTNCVKCDGGFPGWGRDADEYFESKDVQYFWDMLGGAHLEEYLQRYDISGIGWLDERPRHPEKSDVYNSCINTYTDPRDLKEMLAYQFQGWQEATGYISTRDDGLLEWQWDGACRLLWCTYPVHDMFVTLKPKACV